MNKPLTMGVLLILVVCVVAGGWQYHLSDIREKQNYQVNYPYSEAGVSDQLWDRCVVVIKNNLSGWGSTLEFNDSVECNNLYYSVINWDRTHIRVFDSDGLYHFESD